MHLVLGSRGIGIGRDGSTTNFVTSRVDEGSSRNLVLEVDDYLDGSTGEDGDFRDWAKDRKHL